MRDPGPGCPLNECLRFLAGTWDLRDHLVLARRPRRFDDLRRDLGRVSTKVLTTHSHGLREQPPTVEDALTRLGTRLRPVMDAIVDVGNELRKHRGSGVADCEVRGLRLAIHR